MTLRHGDEFVFQFVCSSFYVLYVCPSDVGNSLLSMRPFPWQLSPEGICSGGNGIMLTVEDMARLGQLYLNKGLWTGERLLVSAG